MNNLITHPIGYAKRVSKRGLLGMIGLKDRLVVIGYADKAGVQRKAWSELSIATNPYMLSSGMGWAGDLGKDMAINIRSQALVAAGLDKSLK
jgi:hypothetical protein